METVEAKETGEKEIDFKKVLQDKFPEMQPVKSAPSLGTLNGIGATVYGKSKFDAETNTYTKFYAVCLFFIPIFFISGYRVADANGGGWYFLGKEKLNQLTKFWNYAILLLIIGGIGFAITDNYLNSPEYLTKLEMAKADKAYQSGKIKEALKIYYSILDSGTLIKPPAMVAGEKIYDNDLGKIKKDEFSIIWNEAGKRTKSSKIFPNKNQFTRYGYKYFELYKTDDLKMADFILSIMAESMPEDKDLAKKLQTFRLTSFDLDPTYLPFVIAKALDLESKNDLVKCEEILTPVKSQLKDTEGAKILGNIYFDKGDYAGAYEILKPYFDSKISAFHQAEKTYQNSYKIASDSAYKKLDDGLAGQAWYDKYDKATKDIKDQMVQEYYNKEISKSTALTQANENLNRQSDVINVALQLGIVLLNISSQSEEIEKIKRLKEAETIFLSVQGSASDSDTYQLTYGEVLFWLGKQNEGEKLFDSYLEKHNSDVKSLYNISSKYRAIGNFAKSRELGEKAYEKSTNKEEKEDIAASLAANAIDNDYAIKWLGKSNQNDMNIMASILNYKGLNAFEISNLKEAENLYRDSIKLYEKLPDNMAKFNDLSLVYAALFRITYNLQDFQNYVELLKKSRELAPQNTIVLANYTDALFDLIALEEMEKEIDLSKIKSNADCSLAYFNATNQEEKNQNILKLTENTNFKAIVPLYEQLVLLSPQSRLNQMSLYATYSFKRDFKNINKILSNILSIDFNFAEYKKNSLDFYSNNNNAKDFEKIIQYYKKYDGINTANLNPEIASDIILSNKLSQLKINKDVYNKESFDFSSEISFLEKSYKFKPREYVSKYLSSFYLYQGLNEIYQTSEIYKKEVDKYRAFKFSASHATFVLCKYPELRPIFINNRNFAKYLEITKTRLELFPDSLNISGATCLILLGFDKEDKLKNQFKNNPFLKPEIEINYKLYPMALESVFEKYFYLNLFDNEANAQEIINLAIKEGVPL